MNARRPTNGRHRSSPPGRKALDALAQAQHHEAEASHAEIEIALLRGRVAELEALRAADATKIAALTRLELAVLRHDEACGECAECAAEDPDLRVVFAAARARHDEPGGGA